MKKLIISSLAILGVFAKSPNRAIADTTIPASVQDNILPSLLQHVIAVTEFTTHGQEKVQFLDGLVQFGHYKNDYILALDGGVSNSLNKDSQGRLEATWGVHLHVFSLINNYFNISPTLGTALDMLEVTPRWSYDCDVHKGVLGFTVGARIPFN